MIHQQLLTRPLEVAAGSALDPLVEEVTWGAWRMTGAAPTVASVESSALLQHRMRMLAQVLWQPGRVSMLTQLSRLDGELRIDLAIGCFGPRGESAEDLRAAAVSVQSLLVDAMDLPLTVAPDDPREVLHVRGGAAASTAVIRQHVLQIESPGAGAAVDVLARFNPMPNPWLRLMRLLAAAEADVTVRATALPTRLDVADQLRLDASSARVAAAFDLADLPSSDERWGGDRLRAWRARATINDLRESLATPLYAAEIAVISPEPLRTSLVRAVGCAFTSEADVVHGASQVVVAGQALLLGGFDIEDQPVGLREALALGLPLHGGAGPRELRDLVTLTELPVGLPSPDATGLPGTQARLARSRPVPPELTAGELVGVTPSGEPVRVPAKARDRHAFYIGATGSGKTTLAVARALADLRSGRQVVFIDPHGSAVQRLLAHVRADGIPDVGTLGMSGRRALRWRPFGALPDNGGPVSAERAVLDDVGRFVAAIRAAYSGPRFDQQARALALLASAHRVPLGRALSWYGDAGALAARLEHPRLPADANYALSRLYRGGQDGVAVADWVLSKFSGVNEGRLGDMLASPTDGLDGRDLLRTRRSLLVDLSGLPTQDAGLFGNIVLAGVLDAAMEAGDVPFSVFVDEAQRFPVPSLIRALTEARKFAAGLHILAPSLSGIGPQLADAALAAGTVIAFRQTPGSAGQLAPLLGVPAQELIDLPDLAACLKVVPHPSTTVVIPAYEPVPEAVDDVGGVPEVNKLEKQRDADALRAPLEAPVRGAASPSSIGGRPTPLEPSEPSPSLLSAWSSYVHDREAGGA